MESILTNRVRKQLNWLVRSSFVSLLFILIGCPAAPPPEPVEVEVEDTQPALYEHQVRYSGETLGLIARWYTGKTANWKLIVDANPGMRPERINIGDTIMIPQELMVQQEALPKSSIPRSTGTANANAAVAANADEADGSNSPVGTGDTTAQTPEQQDVDQLEQELEAALGEGTTVEAPTPVEPAADPKIDEDAERERLLDELLSE